MRMYTNVGIFYATLLRHASSDNKVDVALINDSVSAPMYFLPCVYRLKMLQAHVTINFYLEKLDHIERFIL